MLGIYINSHDLQDEWLNKQVASLEQCYVFFNSEIWAEWNHPTFHAQSLPLFQGILVCTCPLTWKFAKKLPCEKVLLWRPEFAHRYRGINSLEALKEAPVYATEKPFINCNFTKLENLHDLQF